VKCYFQKLILTLTRIFNFSNVFIRDNCYRYTAYSEVVMDVLLKYGRQI